MAIDLLIQGNNILIRTSVENLMQAIEPGGEIRKSIVEKLAESLLPEMRKKFESDPHLLDEISADVLRAIGNSITDRLFKQKE